uniref:F-box domain-containing protein n=1 Tax=Caenorhabditis tropicalis TaxID=1561998 RepID=A0A1I7U8S8_9PELO
MSFPLLRLPLLCLEEIIQEYDVYELVFLAQSSKRCYRLVRQLCRSIKAMSVMIGAIRHVTFEPKREHWFFTQDKSEEKRISAMYNFGQYFFSSGQHIDLTMKSMIEYFLELFRCPINEVKINIDFIYNTLDFGFTQCKRIEYSGLRYMDHQSLDYLFRYFRVTDVMNIAVPIHHNFYFDPKIFNSRTVMFAVQSCQWIGYFVFLEFDHIENLGLIAPAFEKRATITYLSRWLASESTVLKRLGIQHKATAEELRFTRHLPMEFSRLCRKDGVKAIILEDPSLVMFKTSPKEF